MITDGIYLCKAYAGGPLSEKNGTKLTNAGVDLVCIYGGTEFGVPSACFDLELGAKNNPAGKTREDWQWMQFTDRVKVRWEPQGDGSYECVLLVSGYPRSKLGPSERCMALDVSHQPTEQGELAKRREGIRNV